MVKSMITNLSETCERDCRLFLSQGGKINLEDVLSSKEFGIDLAFLVSFCLYFACFLLKLRVIKG